MTFPRGAGNENGREVVFEKVGCLFLDRREVQRTVSVKGGMSGDHKAVERMNWFQWHWILGIRVAAVKSTNDLLLQAVSLHGILCIDHSVCQFAQLLRGERLVLHQLAGEREHLDLLLSRQPFYFFDHFNARHFLRFIRPDRLAQDGGSPARTVADPSADMSAFKYSVSNTT